MQQTNSTPLWRELKAKIANGEAGANTHSQYTALAVNNFASLAEVLGNFIEVSEQRKEYHSVFEAATLKRAKDLMAAIS